jgi:hypothetical protein
MRKERANLYGMQRQTGRSSVKRGSLPLAITGVKAIILLKATLMFIMYL